MVIVLVGKQWSNGVYQKQPMKIHPKQAQIARTGKAWLRL